MRKVEFEGYDGHVNATPPALPWHKQLQEDRGQYINNLANTTTSLRHAQELVGMFATDQMQRHVVLTRNPPGCRHSLPAPRPLQDADIDATQEWLQRNGLKRISKDVVAQAIDLVALEHAFHPIRDYLEGLIWDGVPRLHKWLATYLGAEDNPYHAEVGKLFLISMVARVLKPGCKADYMLVLQSSQQGKKKSSIAELLAGEWFSDQLPDISHNSKDVSQHLRGKWLIEVAEMQAMDKADTKALKAFISRSTERYRPPYARTEVNEPRQCVFIGTTNKVGFLRDETGGRRFWPVIVSKNDIVRLEKVRDQLFAEAVSRFCHGEPWYPEDAFEQAHIRPVQDRHYDADEWENTITAWLKHKDRVTLSEIAAGSLGIFESRLGRAEQNRIIAVLERLHWFRLPRSTAGILKWSSPISGQVSE